MSNEIKKYDKKIKVGKIFLYFFITEIFLLILGGLIFLTSTLSPFTDNYKLKWNTEYINNNSVYIKQEVTKYNIETSKVKKCDKSGFSNKGDLLYFCQDKTTYIFPNNNNNLGDIVQKHKSTLFIYLIGITILNVVMLILIGLTNKVIFQRGTDVTNLSEYSRELENVIKEIDEYIDKTGTRLDYRLSTLDALAIGVITAEPDFFNRFGSKIKALGVKAEKKYLTSASKYLNVIYNEMQKVYFIKNGMYLKAIGSELSLILSKYNTSLIGFVFNIIFLIFINILVLYTLFMLNGNNIGILEIANGVINIVTFREHGFLGINIYQQGYLIFLQIIGYIIFLISLKLLINKK